MAIVLLKATWTARGLYAASFCQSDCDNIMQHDMRIRFTKHGCNVCCNYCCPFSGTYTTTINIRHWYPRFGVLLRFWVLGIYWFKITCWASNGLPLTHHEKLKIFLPPANEVCEGYVCTDVCLFRGGVACVAWRHTWQGVCTWQGACIEGSVHGRGMHGRGVHGRGHVWWGHIWQGSLCGREVCVAGGHK